MKILSSIIIICLLLQTQQRSYTLFKQCDSKWGSQALGNGGGKTICQAGCLMSSVAMILHTFGIKVNGEQTNPGTLNHWLKSHGGYVSGDLFVWGSVDKLGLPFYNFISKSALKSSMSSGKHCILNVNSGHHWVLAHGISGSNVEVNDPGFSRTSYPESEIVKIGAYNPVKLTLLEQTFGKQY